MATDPFRVKVNLYDTKGWFRYELLTLIDVWSTNRNIQISTQFEMFKHERTYFFSFADERDMLLFLLTFSDQI